MADDTRDDELAARLQVEPLDDLTRRRLVQRALAESATADTAAPIGRDRSLLTRFVAAAAVLVVVALGVVALLTASDGGNDTTVAGRKSSDEAARATPQAGSGSVAEQLVPESAPDQGASAAAADASSADAATNAGGIGSATNLGDVGDLSSAAARRRLLATIDAREFSETAGTGTGGLAGPCPLSDVSRLLAYGTATFDGRDAFVVVNERADGSRRVRLVISDPCTVRQLR